MNYQISIQNIKIFEFYQKHKTIDIERINILFIDIIERLYEDINPALSTSLATQLLENMRTLQQQMISVNDSVSKSQTDLSTTFAIKFIEFKKEYIEDLKMILTNTTSEKIAPVIKQHNDILLDKTQLLIKEIIPKNNEHVSREIASLIKDFKSSLNNDTAKLLQQSVNKDTLSKFVTTLDEKFNYTLVNSQTMMNNLITSSEQRLDTRISDIRNLTTENFSQIQLQTTVGELLKKMENSSSKGKISENILYNIITPLYPTAEILSVGTTKETGDIILNRNDKPKILLENKNYDRNIGADEIKKFLRDIETQNCSGIMISQHSGIANKENYQIESYNGNIVIYLHNVEYQPERIKVAVDIIDHFKSQILEFQPDSSGTSIDSSVLDEINIEYQNFITQKLALTKVAKEFNQKLTLQIDEFKLPSLEYFLNKKYSTITNTNQEVCEYCKVQFKNQRALSAHLRGCQEKKTHNPAK